MIRRPLDWIDTDRLAAVCAVTAAVVTLVILPLGRYALFELHNDFHFIFLGATALRLGLNPYDPYVLQGVSASLGQPVWDGAFVEPFRRWTHPPFSALLVAPLVPLGEATAFFIYYLVNLACVAIAFALGVRLVTGAPRAWYAAGACAWSWPICTSLALGQVNGLIMAALTLSAWGASRRPRPSAALAGIPIGLAAGLKVLPGIFVIYFLLTRRWAAAGWVVLSGLATLAMPVLAFGPDTTIVAFLQSLHQIAGGSPGMDNMTLPGFILRLYVGLDGLYSGWAYALPATWSAASMALSLGLVGWGLWRARQQAIPAAYLTLVVVVLLAAPVAWVHYAAWAMPFVLGPLADPHEPHAATRWWALIVGLMLVAFLPLHELFWNLRLPDLVLALPWWQVGLVGLLIATARRCGAIAGVGRVEGGPAGPSITKFGSMRGRVRYGMASPDLSRELAPERQKPSAYLSAQSRCRPVKRITRPGLRRQT